MEARQGKGLELTVNKLETVLIRPSDQESKVGGFYFLSNLDQNLARLIVQTIYCFDGNKTSKDGDDDAAKVIKEALAKVLVHYYPLAGRLEMSSDGKLVVRCSGEGVVFVQAEADQELSALGDISIVPHPKNLGKLVHAYPDHAKRILELPLLSVQVTKFKCGGFVLGIAVNHCMVDGITAMEFINSWAEIATGASLSARPFIDRSIFKCRQPPRIEFPHRDSEEMDDISGLAAQYRDEEMKYRSFCFSPELLARLRKLASEDGTGIIGNCTSFTLVAAFVWRARTKALRMVPNQQTKLLIVVDGRTKFDPPMPSRYFGNEIVLACSVCSAGELLEKPLSFAVRMVQDALKMVTEEYIRSWIDCYEVRRSRPSLAATLLISAWTRLAFDPTDFGWGKPIQTGPVGIPDDAMALFLAHRNNSNNAGKSMNVMMGLPATAMETFQELMQVCGMWELLQ